MLDGHPYYELPVEGEPNIEYSKEFLQLLNECTNPMDNLDATIEGQKYGMSKDFIRDRKRGVKKAFEKALGVNAKEFLVHIVTKDLGALNERCRD